ncbi:hypothetical protein [Micromonospora sp. NBC_00617]|uniref:hypothetical protein n=1 Tax=Micromonospora sp. NBC_00617 TaxID=2903587 RepID=UPI0030E02CE6
MQMSELVDALSELRALRVEHDGSALLVTVPAIDVSLRLYPEAVVWLNHRTMPHGEPIRPRTGPTRTSTGSWSTRECRRRRTRRSAPGSDRSRSRR